MNTKLRTFAAWGRTEGRIAGTDMEVGWVRCRTKDGACYRYVGPSGDPDAVNYKGGVSGFCVRIKECGWIDTRFWRMEEGPNMQETSHEDEHFEAAHRIAD